MENGLSGRMSNGTVMKVPNTYALFDSGPEDGDEDVKNEVEYPIVRDPSRRKLVLHFDVRNTVLVADSVTNIFVEQALNSYLTGVTWGKATPTGWQWHSDTPSLTSPADGLTTYYKYLEKKMVHTPCDRAALRQATGDFTQEALGADYVQYFDEHLKLLEWEFAENDEVLTMTGKNGRHYHYILPSVFRLIHYLHEHQRDFCIVIRTYGLDAPNVLACIDYALQGNHPGFPKVIPMKVNLNCGNVTRTSSHIEFEIMGQNKPSGIKTTDIYSTERGIYEMLNQTRGVCGFKDDFRFWQNNNYHYTTAKPFWLNLNDPSVHHIFFDDNIRVTDEDSIVDVRVFDDGKTGGRSLSLAEARHLEDVCLVQADLLQSTANTNYFVDKVNSCEKNYEKLLSTKSFSNGSV